MTPGVTFGLFAVFCVLYQAYVTQRVVARQSFTGVQQVMQIGIIWLLPLIGAIAVHAYLRLSGKPS